MTSITARRAAWSTLAAAAPWALYLLTTRRLQIPRLDLTVSEDDLLDDLFEGEVAASTP
jgi:hypothetical protein